MTSAEYLESVKERLLTDSFIASFEIIRERVTSVDGYLHVGLSFGEHGLLEFAEYFQQREGGEIEVVTYSYNWTTETSELIRRWDNTPHYPKLRGFPHHIHAGKQGKAKPGKPVNIFMVLDEIEASV